MTQHHPDLAAEQEFIDFAYRCLEQSKVDAWKMRGLHEGTLGGTFQARYERDVYDEAVFNRLTQLDLGDAALVFGRIDRLPIDDSQHPGAVENFHIGRLAVADENADPVVVDWRAPVAEPFYRATGRDPLGLARRRHFHVQGRELLGLEDELPFAAAPPGATEADSEPRFARAVTPRHGRQTSPPKLPQASACA